MQLKDFSFIAPTVEAELILRAIETVISPEKIVQSLAQTGSVEERKRKLPAMSLWASDSLVYRPEEFSSGIK